MSLQIERTCVTFLEHALDAVFITRPDGTILYANPAACCLFGYTLEEFLILGRNAVVDLSDPRLHDALDERRRTGRFSGILRMLRKDRTSLTAELSTADFNAEGEQWSIVFVRDVTERKRAENALRESESRLQTTIDNLETIMLVIDPDSGQIVYGNAAAAAFYGWSREQLAAMNISAINTLPPDKLHDEMCAARSESRNYFQFTHRRADGSVRDVEVYSGPIQFQGKALLHSIIHDITSRKQAERALKKSEEKFAKMFFSTPAVISVSRLDNGRLLDVNKEYEKVFEYRRDEIIGRTSYDLGIWVDSSDRDRMVEDLRKEGRVSDVQLWLRSKSGVIHMFRFFAESIILDDIPCVVSAFVDITEQKRAERERDELLIRLQNAHTEIKELSAALPVCSSCKKKNNDEALKCRIDCAKEKFGETGVSKIPNNDEPQG